METMSDPEAACFMALINYTLETGQGTVHVHNIVIDGQAACRMAKITKAHKDDRFATVIVTPYPPR